MTWAGYQSTRHARTRIALKEESSSFRSSFSHSFLVSDCISSQHSSFVATQFLLTLPPSLCTGDILHLALRSKHISLDD
ncbi:hypothetical protein Peur_067346 [Populus x canadensis]